MREGLPLPGWLLSSIHLDQEERTPRREAGQPTNFLFSLCLTVDALILSSFRVDGEETSHIAESIRLSL